MKWFRYKLRENRIFILALLAVNLFYMVEGRNFVYAHQVHEQKEKRLKEISELLDVPVEKLRPDHETLFESLQKVLGIEPEDPVKVAGLKRLQEVLKKHEEDLASNPYLPQIEEVEREHAAYRIEGVLNDLMQLTQPRGGKALPEASQRALLRNLHHALQEELTLPVPEGLPAKAQTKLAEFQKKLDRVFESVRPIVAQTQQPEVAGTLAQKIGELKLMQEIETKRSIREPRFVDRSLPLRQVEKKARTEEVSSASLAKSSSLTPAISESSATPRLPTKDAVAPEIIELANSLGNSPARIFRFVHDSIDLDPKWGAFRGSLGTLWERKGTSWDQAWLLRDLLVAAGVDARFEWGEVEISTELLTNVAGLDDPFRSGDLLTTAGVPIVLLVQGSQVVAARMSHVWVKAFIDYIPNRGVTPGPGDTWIRMDPSLKRYEYAEGIQVHDDVSFSLGDYLQSGTALSPRRAHEDALWAYIRANNIECTTLEQLKKAGSILGEGFPFLPGTLRGEVLQIDGEASDMPAGFQEQVRLEVRAAAGGSLVSWEAGLPALFGQRVDLVYEGATPDDQAILDSNGGVFETPPFLVDLKPVIKVGGVEQASGTAIGSAEDVQIFVTLTPVSGAPDVLVHDGFAGEPNVLVTDFGRLPAPLLERYQAALLAAEAAGDETETELARLQMIGATYMHNLGRDLEDLVGWNWHRMVRILTEGMVTRTGSVTTTAGGEPLTFTRAETFVDIAGMILGLFHTEGDTSFLRPTLELAGTQGSFLEGEVFDQVFQREGIAAVSALTRAKREGQTLTLTDASNLDAVLAAADLGEDVEDQVRAAVGNGKVAWVALTPIDVNQWRGSGYVLADPSTGAAAYLLSGGFAGGANTEGIIEPLQQFLGSEPWLESSLLGRLLSVLIGVLGGGGDDDDGGPGTNQSDPVNLSTGNFWRIENDMVIQARGLPILWSRTYNSRSTHSGPLGFGWTFSYGERLEEQADGSVIYRETDGTEHRFEPDGLGGYLSPIGKHLSLAKTSTTFLLRTKNGIESTFALAGHLLAITDPVGNTVTLSYDAQGNLGTVTDAAGRTVITVTTENGRIVRITDLTGRFVEYTYEGDDMIAVTDTASQVWTYAYDSLHNMIAYSDPLGNIQTYAYDSLDRCIRHVDPLGHVEAFEYPRQGERAVLVDRRGFASFFEFDEQGRAILEVDPLGNATRSEWDTDNNRITTTDPRGGLTSRTFDARGNLLSETNPLQQTTTYTYDPNFNQVLASTDALGNTTTQTYDAQGKLQSRTREVDGETLTETFTYDTFGQLIEMRDAKDNPTTLTWDTTKGSLESQTNALNETTSFVTDDLARPISIVDPVNNAVTVNWDTKGRVESILDPFGVTRSTTYDAAGRQVEITSPRGTTSFVYDAAGRTVQRSDPLGQVTTTEYDPAGNPTRLTDARGNSTSIIYDAVGRPIARIDANGNVIATSFCAEISGGCSTCGGNLGLSGNFCALTDPDGNTTRQEFDALGRVTQTTDPLGNVTRLSYDTLGRRVSETDALNRTTSFEYDALGRLTAVIEADGARTESTYDENGNLTQIIDAESRSWSKTYDALNRLKTESDPLGNTTTYDYDALGNLKSKLTANGDLITFDYDVRRLTATNIPGGVFESFIYDSLGRPTGISNSEVSIINSFDELDRPIQVTNQTLNETIRYTYDAIGNITHMESPRGVTEYFYDSLNRLVQQNDPVTGAYFFEYDILNRRSRLLYPNGLETNYSFDAAGRLEHVITRDRQGEIVDGYSYTYDSVGNRLTKTSLRSGAVEEYEYDGVDRLTRWQRGPERFEEYIYDRVGNRIGVMDQAGVTTYSYDAGNRLVQEFREMTGGNTTTVAYGWDANSNLISKTEPSAGTTFQWDALDRLVQLDGPEGIFNYGYDPFGIRVRESHNGETKRFLHSMEDIVGVYADGALQTYFSHGPGVDEPLAQVTNGSVAYLHRDGIGSVTALSAADGQTSGTRIYAPFGGVETATGVDTRYGYTSRELDPTGLMYYRARYYQPEVGRFTSQDAVRGVNSSSSTLHGFIYALNNPLSFTDPSGNIASAIALTTGEVIGIHSLAAAAIAKLGAALAAVAPFIVPALIILLIAFFVAIILWALYLTIQLLLLEIETAVISRDNVIPFPEPRPKPAPPPPPPPPLVCKRISGPIIRPPGGAWCQYRCTRLGNTFLTYFRKPKGAPCPDTIIIPVG